MPAIIAVLYLPGYLGFRIAGMGRSSSLALAPILSIGLYAILANLYAVLGISSGIVSIFAIPAVALFAGAFFRLQKEKPAVEEKMCIPASIFIFTAIFGLAVGAYVFVLRLPRTDAVFQGWDNVTHLNFIRSFMESGDWSSLHPSCYLTESDAAIQPAGRSGFYPAAWHEICVLAALMSGAAVAKVVNATNYLFCSLVYPLGVVCALYSIFGNKKRILYSGAIVSVSFAQFPWVMADFGPIYPNLAAFCLVPAAIAIVLTSIDEATVAHTFGRPAFCILSSIIALGFVQPNAVFLLAILMFFYLGSLIYSSHSRYIFMGHSISSLVCMNIYYVVCIVLWIAIYASPITAGMLTWRWLSFANSWQEIVNIITVGYGSGFGQNTPAQLLLALMVIIGMISALRRPQYQWIVQTYLLLCIMCFIDAVVDGLLKDVLCAIWYADPTRLASMCAMAAVPLAALGLSDTISFCQCKLSDAKPGSALTERNIALVVAIGFIAANFARFYSIPGWENAGIVDAYSAYDRSLQKYYSNSSSTANTALSQDEQDFAAEALDYISDDSLVINDPSDGSVLLYGIDGMRCYYRQAGHFGNSESEESLLIRHSLKDIATNQKVREAVDSIDARYVLILDGLDKDDSFLNLMGEDIDGFSGIEDITDSTPGFKLILKRGRMRLYEIVE